MARPIKHRGKFRIRWQDASGRRRSACFTSYSAAERALRKFQAEADDLRAGLVDPVAKAAARKSFDDLADYWLDHVAAHKRSDKDDRSILRRHLRPALGGRMLSAVDQKAVDRLKTALYDKGLADNTVANVLSLLRAMFNKAVDLGWLSRPPKVAVPKPALEDYNWIDSLEVVRAFVRAARAEELAPLGRRLPLPGLAAMYATSVYTGMRAGEVAGLKWAMVDLDLRLITVARSFDHPTKTKAIRRIPVLDPLLPLMKEWRMRCSWSRSGVVFPNSAGKMHVPRARVFKQVYRRVLDRAAVEPHHPERRLTYHDLRHTFASLWVQNGGDLFRLQKILGHKDVNMTLRYSHLAPAAFQKDHDRLGGAIQFERAAVLRLATAQGG